MAGRQTPPKPAGAPGKAGGRATPADIIEIHRYRRMKQSRHLNQTSRMHTAGIATGAIKQQGDSLTYREAKVVLPAEHQLRATTHRLLTVILIVATETGAASDSVEFSVLAEMLGCRIEGSTRTRLDQDCKALAALQLTLPKTDTKKDKELIARRMPLFDSIERCRGRIVWTMSDSFYRYFQSCRTTMPVADHLLKVNCRNSPYALAMGRFSLEQERMNPGRCLAIASLMKVCHAAGMPTPEQVAATGGHYHQQIVDPLLRDLTEALGGQHWQLCNANGKGLTPAEHRRRLEFNTFKRLRIKITFPNYPVRKSAQQERESCARIGTVDAAIGTVDAVPRRKH